MHGELLQAACRSQDAGQDQMQNVERRRAEAAQTEGKKDATPTSGSESHVYMSKGLSLAPVVIHFVMIAGYDGHRSPLTYL